MNRPRHMSRSVSLCILVAATGLSAASCGTSNNNNYFTDAGTPVRPFDSSLGVEGGGNGNGYTDATVLTPGNQGDGGLLGSCTPRTCLGQGLSCGMNGDGCGGVIDCGVCTPPQFCGGGGPNQCGAGVEPDGGATTCTPTSCAALGYDCGPAADGCGGILYCNANGSMTPTCTPPATCGGGGFNKCGVPTPVVNDAGEGGYDGDNGGGDGSVSSSSGPDASLCIPATCASLGYNCGAAGDGCGGILDCSQGNPPCVSPQFCGGAAPSKCGGYNGMYPDGGIISQCTPTTCAALGFNCGPAGDGCGGILDCSQGNAPCTSPEFCGGAGPGKCGGNNGVNPDGGVISLCVPQTCPVGACGPMSDGCGNSIQCTAVCTGNDICGGGGVPFQCGHSCTNLCQDQTACPGGVTTTLTGTVRAGVSAWLAQNHIAATPDPVPNVLVYVPNGPVAAMNHGYTAGACPSCSSDVTGDPLVSTYTDFDGTFTLTNVPAPATGTIPVVIQMGRWRRQFTVPVTACVANPIAGQPPLVLNLPQNQTQGDIPLTAISTGSVDSLECVLLKMGIDQAEFTNGTGTGRIQLYSGEGDLDSGLAHVGMPGATLPGALTEEALLGSAGSYFNYDQIMLPCWGKADPKTEDKLADLVTYANSGGHFFATHYSYSWLYQTPGLSGAANWAADKDNPGSTSWKFNVSKFVPPSPPAPHAETFAKWLNLVNALVGATPDAGVPAQATVSISNPRYDVSSVANGSVDWIDGVDQGADPGTPLVEHFAFDTPVGGPTHCGHAIFSDFHVTNAGNSYKVVFPQECPAAPLTAQERILEYMIWDLGSCISPPKAVCNPLTCAQQNIECGPAGDGCGNALPSCGTCAPPLSCGGGGTPGVCGEPEAGACVPLTCTQQNIACGPAGDGCGGLINSCGTCPPGETCGGGGVPGHCGAPDAGACEPQTCMQQNIACGPAGDGCGNLITSCGTCPVGQTCGGGGVSGQCGAPEAGAPDGGAPPACVPESCMAQNIACGPAGDGCGNLIASCGTCTPPQTCGGGGVPGQCGGATCIPLTCSALKYNCGPAGDGCGATIDCGVCVAPDTCGGGGTPGVCGTKIPK